MHTSTSKAKATLLALAALFISTGMADAQGYYSYQKGDYKTKNIHGGYKVTTVPNITLTYGGDVKGEGSFTPADNNPKFSGYTTGVNTPILSDGETYQSSYTPDNKLVPDSGTYYKLEPIKNGTVAVYIYHNSKQERDFYITCQENGTGDNVPVEEYPNGSKISGRLSECFTFSVKANNTYYIFANSTSPGLQGFIYVTDELVLSDDKAYDPSLANNTVFRFDRTLVKDNWNTICLPFDLSKNDCKYLFGDGYAIAKLKSVSLLTEPNNFEFVSATTYGAGRPALVKPTKDVSSTMIIDTLKNTPAASRGSKSIGFFRGTYAPYDIDASDNSIWFLTAGNKLSQASQNGTMKGYRAYFQTVETATGAKPNFIIDGVSTGIQVVDATPEAAPSVVYDLQGRQYNNRSQLPKGPYIVNGKKVIVK